MSSMTDQGADTRGAARPMSRADFARAYSFGGATSSHVRIDEVDEPAGAELEDRGDEEIGDDDEDEVA